MWRLRDVRRAHAETQRTRRLLDAVAAFSDASRRSSAAVVERLDCILRELDGRIDVLLLFHPSGEDLACVYAGGARAAYLRGVRLARDDPRYLPARAAQTGCRATPGDGTEAMAPTDRFAIAVPMVDAGTLLAVVYAASPDALDGALRDAIVSVVERAAAPYAVALERESDRDDAARDPLTGLLSPSAFRRCLAEETMRAAGGDRALCVWYADTDGFKDVNDRFGHRAGDAVLQTVATLLESHLVAGLDFAARDGGDEFCALLRATGKRRAIERAQAFCDALRACDFGVPVRVTASVGVAAFPHDATTARALLDVADAAMYRSKRDGRDRVSFAASPGVYASLRPEAARRLSRTHLLCRSSFGESSERRCSR